MKIKNKQYQPGAQAPGARFGNSPRRLRSRLEISRCTAAILAGGLGTRLRPMVADRPKVLAAVHGRPYLVHLLDRLAAAGIRETVLLTGYQADQVFRAVGEEHAGMKLVHSVEARPLGTGGALRNALEKLSSSVILLLNGDSWCAVDLQDFWQFHRRNGAEVSMVLARVEDPARFGKVEVGQDGNVKRFEEKQAGGSGWINAGVYLIARTLIEEIPHGPGSLERALLPHWLEQGKKVFGYRHFGTFLDIGTPASYADAEALIPQRKEPA